MIGNAIKDLREHIGRTGEKKEKLSQNEFGKYLGVEIATVQRYEKYGAPLHQLVTLTQLAAEHGRPELAEIFKEAAIGSVPAQVQTWIAQIQTAATVIKRKRA